MDDQEKFRKAAVILISLGPRVTGEILKRLPESVVEKLTAAFSTIDKVTKEERLEVFREFHQFRLRNGGVRRGGEDFAREALEAAMGSHRAGKILNQATGFSDDGSFEMLKRIDPLTVSNFLKAENPQTIALVLVHLDPRTAGPILGRLPTAVQAEVTLKMAMMDQPNPEYVSTVQAILSKLVMGAQEQMAKQFGGKKQVAEVLNEIEQEVWTEIIEEMRSLDEDTAADVKNLMFVFEDIIGLDDRYIQEFLKEIDGKELTMALKAASEDLRDKILGNMSKRAAQGIVDDMEYMGPVKLSEVQEAQQRVVDVIRRLEEEGTIIIGSGKGGDVLV